jgi:hypothetical protein
VQSRLSEDAAISIAITPTGGVADSQDVLGAALDMGLYQDLLTVVTFGAIESGAEVAIKMQEGDESDLSDAEDLKGTGQTVSADTDGDTTVYVDLRRPTKRYVRIYVSRATANAVVASALYVRYNGRHRPSTHGENVRGETWSTPIEGTA